jgi:hypothetical protein
MPRADPLDAALLDADMDDADDLWTALVTPSEPLVTGDGGMDIRIDLVGELVSTDDATALDVAPVPRQDAVRPAVDSTGSKSLLASLWDSHDAERTSTGVKEEAPASPLLWANPAQALMTVDAPNTDTMEMRRRKNREGMRLARQRQREDYNRLKASVARLEEQYAQLCLREAPALEDILAEACRASDKTGGTVEDQQQRRFLLALTLTKRLRAENMFLKAGLQQHSTWKQHLHRILDSTADLPSDLRGGFHSPLSSPPSSPGSSPSPRSTRASVSRPIALHVDAMDAHEAETLFHFSPLNADGISRVIIDNAHQAQQIRSSLLASADTNDPHVRRSSMLGWDVIQRIRGTYFENVYTKTFTDLDVGQAGQNMWMNDMFMDTFRVILYNLQRLETLQRVDTNGYILGRDVKQPDGNTVFRSVFLRFRTQVTREIANGSSPPLRATGFVIGSHSITRDWSSPTSLPPYRSYHPADGGDRPAGIRDGEALEWADFVYTTEFLTIEDPVTGETRHQIQWTGCSDFKSRSEAMRSASDGLTVCLRTEMLMFRPAFQLQTISDTETR